MEYLVQCDTNEVQIGCIDTGPTQDCLVIGHLSYPKQFNKTMYKLLLNSG